MIPHPSFRQEQMAGGGNGEELGNPLEATQQQCDDPFRHAQGDQPQIRQERKG